MASHRWRNGLIAAAVAVALSPGAAFAQVVQGVEQGANAGSKAAGPVGGVLGGALGGVVGVVTGVLGGPLGSPSNATTSNAPPPAAKSGESPAAKSAKTQKGTKPAKQQAAPAPAPPPLTAEQIVANSDRNIERIKTELKLSAEQEKHWPAFASAMHYVGHNGAERLNLRIARAKRDPPDDIIEQMRNEAQFLYDRGNDQRNVADAAEPLFATLDDRQKQIFINEMVRLSQERGLD